MHVDLFHRAIPVVRTVQGLRAVSKDKPVTPESVARYLQEKFGDDLAAVKSAMTALARSLPPDQLADRAYKLYES